MPLRILPSILSTTQKTLQPGSLMTARTFFLPEAARIPCLLNATRNETSASQHLVKRIPLLRQQRNTECATKRTKVRHAPHRPPESVSIVQASRMNKFRCCCIIDWCWNARLLNASHVSIRRSLALRRRAAVSESDASPTCELPVPSAAWPPARPGRAGAVPWECAPPFCCLRRSAPSRRADGNR